MKLKAASGMKGIDGGGVCCSEKSFVCRQAGSV